MKREYVPEYAWKFGTQFLLADQAFLLNAGVFKRTKRPLHMLLCPTVRLSDITISYR